MNNLRIHTQIHSRYQVFDASGHLPFSIVFGLCRRSAADNDPRPLLLDTAGSALDVPYALAHRLLTIHEQHPDDAKRWVEVDLSRLEKSAPSKGLEWLSLPSPTNRKEHWRDAFTVYQCPIEPDGEVASVLEPGKKYTIKLASEDLGVTRWAYSDRKEPIDSSSKPSHDPGAAKLVNSKHTAGKATFKVVSNLPRPPQVETRIHLPLSSPPSGSPLLEISVLNTGPKPIIIQTCGHQRFLIPWGPFQPVPDALDDRMRIIHATPHKPPTSSLRLIDSMTGALVRRSQRRGTSPLIVSNAEGRPKVDDVVQLKPGVPVVRRLDISALVVGLKDGQYKVRMQAKGCRWWHGEISKEECKDGRLPAHVCKKPIAPPLMLESQDEVELRIRNGKVAF
ncbi:MAG: hypothetical protein Q9207_006522 [Kuettlingeria erythrocarpa]